MAADERQLKVSLTRAFLNNVWSRLLHQTHMNMDVQRSVLSQCGQIPEIGSIFGSGGLVPLAIHLALDPVQVPGKVGFETSTTPGISRIAPHLQ